MLKSSYLSRKINTPIVLGKYRNVFIGATVALATIAIIVFVLMKNTIMNIDTEHITNADIENNTDDNSDLLDNLSLNEQIESNEQIIYIAPEDLYIDDNVIISVTSHVDGQLYGQGIRFEYRNKSVDELVVTVMPVEANETLDSIKTIVEPGAKKTCVLYIGLDTEPFKEGIYTFIITDGYNSYTTEEVMIKAK